MNIKSILVVIMLCLLSSQALAYNYDSHTYLVEQAIDTLEKLNGNQFEPQKPDDMSQGDWDTYIGRYEDNKYIPEIPSVADMNSWNEYVDQASNAIPLLLSLRSGLPLPYPKSESERTECDYHCEDNLNAFGEFPISEIKYYDFERYFGKKCSMTPYRSTGENTVVTQARVLGEILGRYAGRVDDINGETVLAFRPSSTIAMNILHLQNDIINATTWQGSIFALFAPVYCVAKWLQSEKCHPDKIWNTIGYRDPLNIVEAKWDEAIMNINGRLKGMWHMVQTDLLTTLKHYNYHPAGAALNHSGPIEKSISALELAIVTTANLSGAHVNPYKSNGVKHYTPYDDVERTNAYWNLRSLGHVHFSPVDNLAAYGWDNFLDNPSYPNDLGRPLHAIADMSIPQHMVGTIARGHAGYEAAFNEGKFLKKIDPYSEDIANIANIANPDIGLDIGLDIDIQMDKLVFEDAYIKWKELCGDGSVNDLQGWLGSYVEKNRGDIFYYYGYEWMFDTSARETKAKEYYENNENFFSLAEVFWKSAKETTLAFLICASNHVEPLGAPANMTCGPGEYFDIMQGECVEGPCDQSIPEETDIGTMSSTVDADAGPVII